jgi:hydroxymethylbilane synthase
VANKARRAATRKSPLARTQTSSVGEALGVELEHVVVETAADKRPDTPVWELNDRGVFVKEVQAAVLEGRADIAVHSAKDLPSSTPDGLVIAAIPEREDARDALVGSTLDGIPVGGRVGTGSVRRRAQLGWLRSDLTFGGVRGNIGTRLEKTPDFDAIVVAAAALRRLGRLAAAAEILDVRLMVPQVGQGALAVECRADDEETRELLAAVDHRASRRAVQAERAWLAEMGGGCDRPVGAYASIAEDGDEPGEGTIHLTAIVASGDGRVMLRHEGDGDDPVELGRRIARHLLDQAGGHWLLDEASPFVSSVGSMTTTLAPLPR